MLFLLYQGTLIIQALENDPEIPKKLATINRQDPVPFYDNEVKEFDYGASMLKLFPLLLSFLVLLL